MHSPKKTILVVIIALLTLVLTIPRDAKAHYAVEPVEDSLAFFKYKSAPEITFEVPRYVYWKWNGAEEYKNERLRYYQELLQRKGIKNPDHLRNLVAQLIQENGALTAERFGDNGCSFGLIQLNTCRRPWNMKASRFLELYPEWKSWKYQLNQMVLWMNDRKEMYNGNIFRMVIHHNCPVCARENYNNGYWDDVRKREPLLTLQ